MQKFSNIEKNLKVCKIKNTLLKIGKFFIKLYKKFLENCLIISNFELLILKKFNNYQMIQ